MPLRYYVVSYDLRGEVGPQDYIRLSDALRTAPEFCRALLSFWIVGTSLSPSEIVTNLRAGLFVDPTDGIVVLEITGRGDYFGIAHPAALQWLQARITRT